MVPDWKGSPSHPTWISFMGGDMTLRIQARGGGRSGIYGIISQVYSVTGFPSGQVTGILMQRGATVGLFWFATLEVVGGIITTP